ncbi:hypothetical protein J6590_067496 [Homalodisca vitripennis]|nr:hypothetical protein J6590_067496 [Homalodisca vitripennis]
MDKSLRSVNKTLLKKGYCIQDSLLPENNLSINFNKNQVPSLLSNWLSEPGLSEYRGIHSGILEVTSRHSVFKLNNVE